MKKLIFYIFALLPLLSFGQELSGRIIYKETFKMNFEGREMPAHMKEMMKSMPKEQSVSKQLIFNRSQSLFKSYTDPNAPIEAEISGPGGWMRRMMMRAEEEVYINIAENRVAQHKEMFGRTFLIRDSLEKHDWKVTGEMKQILEYNCMKATTLIDSNEVIAWFCPTLPVSMGPEGMGQLPGMILELSMRKGQMVVIAEKVELDLEELEEIVEPKKGKVMTREEFKKTREEKRKEMKEMGGRGMHGH